MSDDHNKKIPSKPLDDPESIASGGAIGETKTVKKTAQQIELEKKEAAKAGSGESINQEPAWTAIRQGWAKEQVDMAQAYALSLFDVEDDLPLSRHLLLAAIVLFFAFFIAWANFASLDEVTRGDGRVIPSTEIQALQSFEGGIVEDLLVSEGDLVQAGDVLVRLSDIEASSDLGANSARYYGLLASIIRLQAEAEGELTVDFPDEVLQNSPSSVTEELNALRANQQKLQGQLNIFLQQLSQKEQEVRELETRIADTRRVLRLQQQEMEMIRPLVERGSAPKLELLQLERAVQEKRSELNGYLSSLPRSKAAVEEVRARIDEVTTTAQAQAQVELSAKQIELNEIKERLSALKERKTRTEIKSPVHGTIKELMVNTVGGVVRPGEDIIQIVPKDDQLLVEARIRPADIAFLYPEQPAVVKITAYDFSIYGGLKGQVVNISADSIEDENGDSFYRVRIRTHESELKRNGQTLPIIPGMVASVDVLTGKKTVMQYLLKPIVKTLNNSMNER